MDYILAVAFATIIAWVIVGLIIVVVAQRTDLHHFQEMAKHWRTKASEARSREWRCARLHEEAGEEFVCPRPSSKVKGGDSCDEEERKG